MSDRKQQRISFFLLAVYVMMLAASGLHVHVSEGGASFICQDCANHVKHPGHIASASPSACECLLCSFFSSSYLPAQTLVLSFAAAVFALVVPVPLQRPAAVRCVTPALRAPPCR